MFLRTTALVVAATLTSALGARAASEPTVGERIVQATASRDRLWVRDSDGVVAEFARAGGQSQILSRGVVVMARLEGHVIAVRHAAGGQDAYELVDLSVGRRFGPTLRSDDAPVAIFAARDFTLLTRSSLLRLHHDAWSRVKLSRPIWGPGQVSVALSRDGTLYAGINRGEWGGAAMAISVATGAVQDAPVSFPITGLAPDQHDARCVLASGGLIHFFARGAVIRICGSHVDAVYEQSLPPAPDNVANGTGTWPFFGIATNKDGWIAVSPGTVFSSKNGTIQQQKAPAYESWGGLRVASLGDEALLVETDMNRAFSLSGDTPLLVQVEH